MEKPSDAKQIDSTRSDENAPPPPSDWAGPNDPDNPLTWSLGWKIYTMIMISLQSLTSTFGTSVISPATQDIAEHFHVSTTVAILPLSVYVLGLALGPAISAPLSETYGRRSVYLFCFPASLLFTLGAGLSSSHNSTIAGLIICRFLAATLCSGCLAVGAGSMGDIWLPRYRATAGAVFTLVPFLGPALGPSVGGYVVQQTRDWRWTQWCILFLGAFTYALALPQRETYKKIILRRRHDQDQVSKTTTAGPGYLSASVKDQIKFFLTISIFRPIHMILTEPIVGFLSTYTAFNFAVLFCFFAAFPIIYQSPYPESVIKPVYHFNMGEAGLVFLGLAIGNGLATCLTILLDCLVYQRRAAAIETATTTTGAVQTPEERLLYAKIGSWLLPASLFWFAWTARADVHWIVPTLATVIFAMGNLLVFSSTMFYLVDTYGARTGASAVAANGILRYIAGAVFPLFTVQMYVALGVAWATSILAFVTVVLVPIPWVLAAYGPQIRARSRYT